MKTEAQAAAALITRPFGWTQRVFARTENGFHVPWQDNRATCFCMIGAIRKVTGETYSALEEKVRAYMGTDGGAAFAFNDDPNRTAAQVAAKILEAANAP
jgi:hypothetical protein